MTETNPPPAPPPPKRRRWVISLRRLFVAVLLLNVAAAAWYQWPWTVRRENNSFSALHLEPKDRVMQEMRVFVLPSLRYEQNDPPNYAMLHSDWSWQSVQTRNRFPTGSEDHGLTKLYFADGSLYGVDEYHAGKRRGRHERYYPDGNLLTKGYLPLGNGCTAWEVHRPTGGVMVRSEYDPLFVLQKLELYYRPEDAAYRPPNWIQASEARDLEVDVVWTYVGGDLRRSEEVQRDKAGERRIVRHFLKEARHGRQENRDERDRLRFEADWNDDRPVGRWACYGPAGDCRLSAEFRQGKLVRVNNRPTNLETEFRIREGTRLGRDNYLNFGDRPVVLRPQSRPWRDVLAAILGADVYVTGKPSDDDRRWDEVVEWEWEGPGLAIEAMVREVVQAKSAAIDAEFPTVPSQAAP